MGQVYKAMDINLDRPVAIKLLSNRTFGDKTFLERFRREARLAAKLNHSNIATIYSFGEDNGEPYIAMEFVEGETLEQRIKRKSLSIAEVRKFGQQTASALVAAHALGIIHRDIKPANLMITKDGNLKVMDFGVARRAGETSLTMAGSLIGTANIMAPELIKGKEATPSADLFSLGCVLYECIAGLPAFHGEDAMAVLYKISNEDPPPLKDLRAETPDDLVAIIDGLLIKDPEKRFGPAEVVSARIASKTAPAANETMALDPGDLGTMVLPGTDIQTETMATGKEASGSGGWFAKNRTWVLGASGGIAVLAMVAILKLGGGPPDQITPSDPVQAKMFNDQAAGIVKDLLDGDYAPGSQEVEDAKDKLLKATKLDVNYATPWHNLGLLSLEVKDYEDAERNFNQALIREKNHEAALLGLADALHYQRNRNAEAEQYYRDAIKEATTEGSFVTASNNFGFHLVSQEKFEEAIEILTPAIKRAPRVSALYKNKALALFGMNNLEAAGAAAESALVRRNGFYPEADSILTRVREQSSN